MNNSEFKSFEIVALKSTAKTVNTLVTKKNKLKVKIEELYKELDSLEETIDKWEAPIKERFGYSTEDLLEKVTTNNSTKWVLKYPDTIIPPTKEPNDTEIEETINNLAASTQSQNSSQEVKADNSEEAKEVFEEFMTQQAIDAAKEPTSDMPFEE